MPALILKELLRFFWLFGLAALVGWLAGSVLAGLLTATLLVLGLHLFQLGRMLVWLRRPEDVPPEARGLWGRVFDELYRLQRQNRQAQNRLQLVLDKIQQSSQALRDGIIMIDRRGDVEWWNQAATHLLGLRMPSDKGNPITHLLRDPRFVNYFEKQQYREPLVLPSPVAEGRSLEYQITLFGENERLMLVRDFTRTQRLEQMRQDFIANVSHELRTPLTVLSGYLETFADHAENLDPKWVRGLELMQQQAARMEHLVEDLLMLSRLETSSFEPAREPLDISQLLQTILQDAQALSDQKHRIELNADASLQIYGCEKELRSAFSNLVFNAVKYTPPDSTIELKWHLDRSGAHFEVIDNGPGIEPQHLSRLTERFYRVDQGRASSTGGTGLGLAIVKHVMLRHQGRLSINSAAGRGSRFCCHFPASSVYVKAALN